MTSLPPAGDALGHFARIMEPQRVHAGYDGGQVVSGCGAFAFDLTVPGGQVKAAGLSIVGVLPFSLALPYGDLFWTNVLVVCIGIVLSSAFSAIVVFAQELVPGRVGMIAGIFFGFAFGMGGLAAAILGVVADARGIEYVFQVCSYLPLIGLLTIFLPDIKGKQAAPKPL